MVVDGSVGGCGGCGPSVISVDMLCGVKWMK